MLYELLYTSAARHHVDDAELEQILESSQRNNARRGVTGLLLFHQREFVQLLEGEESAVRETFGVIAGDSRHDAVRVLYEGPCQERGFANWAMALVRLDEVDAAQIPGLPELLTQGLASAKATDVRTVGKRLLSMFAA